MKQSLIQKYNLHNKLTYLLILSAATLVIFYSTNKSIQGNYISAEAKKIGGVNESDSLIINRILLIGDAGDPSLTNQEPVLLAMQKQAIQLQAKSFIITLGDNIYPYGMPGPVEGERLNAENKFKQQLDLIINSKVNAVFLPGNHDWAQGTEEGLNRVKNEQAFIDSKYFPQIRFLPENGCPGPSVVEVGSKIKIIVLDSQWWLHSGTKPTAGCDCNSEIEIVKSLDSLLTAYANDLVIIAAHHPLISYGPHGGYFSWKDHVFPLLNINSNLWIPLPVIGSIYPLTRMMGISNQDMSNSEYQHYIFSIENVLKNHQNIIYASGHEHSLQILNGINNSIYLVSGFGTSSHHTELTKGERTMFAASQPGFMQIDLYKDGNVQLSVFEVDEKSNPVKAFSFCPFR